MRLYLAIVLALASTVASAETIEANGSFSSVTDLNGQCMVLDADGDTSICSDTDDQIDIEVAGTDLISIDASNLALVNGAGIDLNQNKLHLNTAADNTYLQGANATTINFYVGGTLTFRFQNNGLNLRAQHLYSSSVPVRIGLGSCTTDHSLVSNTDAIFCGDVEHDGTVWFDAPPVFAGYTREIDVAATAAALGPTAPAAVILGTSYALCFDDNDAAEVAYMQLEVPSDWDGASDATLEVYFYLVSAPSDTETVDFVASYAAVEKNNGEQIDPTATSASGTYTQSGAGTAEDLLEATITIDYDDATNPLAAGDLLPIKFNRAVSGTASGDACVLSWHFEYTSNALPSH